MALNREELISCLNDLIETCRDGENGFQTAAENVRSESLKQLFHKCSLQRAQFASELQAEVRQLGGTPVNAGTLGSAIRRGWMNIKSAVSRGNDDAIIDECERSEEIAVAAYQEILKQNFPPNVLPVVKHQYKQIKRSHDRLRDRDEAA